jgi:uncharacterized protein YigE (DUF2233 family)
MKSLKYTPAGWLLLILLFCCNVVSAQLSDKELVTFVPNKNQQVQLFWRDDKAQLLRSLAALKQHTDSKKQTLVFAMNGGMYEEDRSPLGLFIQAGKAVKKLNTGKGTGNFYLQPNGVFYITKDGKGHVCKTIDFKESKNIQYATQSGPMLIINGMMHDAFKAGSANVNIRNGIGIKKDGTMLFAMSRKQVSLYDFANYFKSQGCINALYLDGFVSRTYYPAGNWIQTDGNFGVMIGVVSK